MTQNYAGLLLAAFGLSLILITLSLRLLRGPSSANDSTSFGARFFLIALRLAIGWHCFIEGMEKINSPTWSSEAYLREAMGPLSDYYRNFAGDRLVNKLTVESDGTFPAELDRDWRNYLHAFAAYYDLSSDQIARCEAILEQNEKDTLAALAMPMTVTKISAFPPDLKIEMTMKQRLEEHEHFLERVQTAESKFPSEDKDVMAEWKSAKADLGKWRVELKKFVDAQTLKFKKADEGERTRLKKAIDADNAKLAKAKTKKTEEELKKDIAKNTVLLNKKSLTDVLTSLQRQSLPIPEPVLVPMESWRELEISDFAVKWSLVVLGSCLMLGLFSRLSSFGAALLILSFYAAMPPLPGWPESPRLEGHYLLINKTLIEVIALLALTFIPTGRWAGLDGFLHLCFGYPTKSVPSGR